MLFIVLFSWVGVFLFLNLYPCFSTVVDFPVVGYVPPEVLTELHFLLNHCAVELSPPSAAPAKVSFDLCNSKR